MVVEMNFAKVETLIEGYSRKVDALIDGYAGKQELLISVLQDVQAAFGYLPKDMLIRISQRLDIPLTQVFSVATFFRSFSLKPRGRHTVTVCCGTACHVRGGARILQKLERDLGVPAGETTEDERFTLETARCLGACAMGPLVVVDGRHEGQMNPDKLDGVLKKYK